MYIIYINNTLPLATDLYMKLYTELGRLWFDQQKSEKTRKFDQISIQNSNRKLKKYY